MNQINRTTPITHASHSETRVMRACRGAGVPAPHGVLAAQLDAGKGGYRDRYCTQQSWG
jgi:hypothetical protein